MARKLAALAFSLGCLYAGSVLALGLGELKAESFLNQPFRATVDLLNMGGLHEEEIRVRLGTSEDFARLGLDRPYFLTGLTFEVIVEGNRGKILISSEDPVLEPYLDFIIEARWPTGRLLREYTVLIDPPAFSQATPVISASERVAAVEGIPAPDGPDPRVGTETPRQPAWDYDQAVRTARPPREEIVDAAGSLAPGSRYMVRRNQTLWEIASQARPAGVSVHQAMLDIQRLNPDAFINGNINRIKAGYVIYLPTAADISSSDLPAALAEVREHNQAWREGRDLQVGTHGPSLRISAEPEESAVVDTPAAPGEPAPAATADTGAAAEADETAPAAIPASDTESRLAALEQQLETLQRIISLKDDQIAALQDALAEARALAGAPVLAEIEPEGEVRPEIADMEDPASVEETGETALVEDQDETVARVETDVETAAEDVSPAVAAPPAVATTPAETPPPVTEAPATSSWSGYLPYLLGVLVVAGAGYVYARRRRGDEEEAEEVELAAPVATRAREEDAFAEVQSQPREVKLAPAATEPKSAASQTASGRNNRGYGERRHDEYASDFDAADALAEADIYIAYGRHQQAIDLLNNALAIEPGNLVYRLKLLEIFRERGDEEAAAAQFSQIQASGDTDSIAHAEALMQDRDDGDGDAPTETSIADSSPLGDAPGLSPNPFELFTDSGEALEHEFSGLRIEGADPFTDDEDLDLSLDVPGQPPSGSEEEDLVIAADSNALSTKLDLARAYLDMGDDEGARQILDEVLAEGTQELKAEAQALLERIGG